MVLLAPAANGHPTILHSIPSVCPIQRFTVLACGPDVRDLQPKQTVLANHLAATAIGKDFLLPDSAIIATL